MLKIEELNLGFSDAENYKRRENKELLNHLFLRTPSLEKLCSPSTTFLVGEKELVKQHMRCICPIVHMEVIFHLYVT